MTFAADAASLYTVSEGEKPVLHELSVSQVTRKPSVELAKWRPRRVGFPGLGRNAGKRGRQDPATTGMERA